MTAKDSRVSDVIDRTVISNPNEEGSSGDKEDKVASSETMNSTDSELACPLD
jgi:hypothetical protein